MNITAALLDFLMSLLKNPEATIDELIEIIPAPDFPTGGRIVDSSGIRDAYLRPVSGGRRCVSACSRCRCTTVR